MKNEFAKFFKDTHYFLLKNNFFNYLHRKRLIRWYAKRFLQGERFVDIGCGISPVTPYPQKTLLMDVEEDALVYLQKKGYATRLSSVTCLDLESESVDAVFCSEVLEHVEDDKKGLQEIARVLKKGGRAFITVPCWKKYWEVDDEIVGHWRRYDPSIFSQDMEGFGLRVIARKQAGSLLDRKMLVFFAKRYKAAAHFPKYLVVFYVMAMFLLSWLTTLSVFLTTEKKADIGLFVCEKV